MTNSFFWIKLLIWALLGVGISCLLACSSQQVHMIFLSFFNIFYRPLSVIHERVLDYMRGIRTWAAKELQEESERKDSGPIYFIIGAVLYSIFTLLFMFCDFGMAQLTAQAMGMDIPRFHLPIDTSTLTAATLISTALFWGAVIFDILGVTHLAPWRSSFSEKGRKYLLWISISFIAIATLVAVSMAYWRGVALTQVIPEAGASQIEFSGLSGGLDIGGKDGLDLNQSLGASEQEQLTPIDIPAKWTVFATLMGIAFLSVSSTAFSMVGIVKLAKFVIILPLSVCSFVTLLPIAFICWLGSTVLNLIFTFVQSAIDFLVHIGSNILGFFGWEQPEPKAQANSIEPEAPSTSKSTNEPSAELEEETLVVDPGFNPFPRR